MIIGLGNDLIDIRRIERTLERFGDRFIQRVFTEVEQAKSDRRAARAASYAKRFAAKEAVAKAAGTGIGAELGFHSIQIEHDANGRPILRFLEYAQALVERLNISNALVSLSDEKNYVVAMVVLES